MASYTSLLVPALPLLLGGAWLALLPAPLATIARPRARITVLTIALLSFIASLLMIRAMSHSDSITASRLLSSTLSVLAAGLIAAPLLDRARQASLVMMAALASVLILPLLFHGFIAFLPPIGGIGLLQAVLIVTTILGLCGSAILPRHPVRYSVAGVRQRYAVCDSTLASGWLLLAATLTIFASTMAAPDLPFSSYSVIASALTAALLAALTNRQADGTASIARAATAGALIAISSHGSLEYALILGALAAILSAYTEAALQALRIDDPHHFSGNLLMPAAISLLLSNAPFVHTAIWLYASLGLGFIASALLWPLTKLLIGLADPNLDEAA